MTNAFRYRFRVRYNECDAQQVVFNARYADYVDLAMTEFMRAIGRDYTALLARGLDNQVVKLTLEWQAPARFDEVIEVRVSSPHVGLTSFAMAYEIVHAATDRVLCTAEAVYVMMTTDPFEKTPVPDDLRAALGDGAVGQVIDHSGS
ncbi:acyl-CoA thioesterase [Salinisphaera aquimarina]|uniref:Acyl-CoA thioesterase n=1 Tax=Salinisphaera aquimarina TaxID=2094031 RepID=A0ABV7EQR9_9GAMM